MNRTAELSPSTDVLSLGIFLSLIAVATIGGNLLVILAVGMVQKLRTPSNFLIVSLAVSDLLVGILVIPITTVAELMQTWALGEAMCDMYISFDVFMCTASILNLCAISIDRYLAITRPLQYAAKRTPKRMLIMIAVVWVASALISIPPMFGFKEEFIPGKCEYSENFIYQIYATCGAFYIPLLVMLVLYGRIFMLARHMAQEDARQMRVSETVAQRTSGTPLGLQTPSIDPTQRDSAQTQNLEGTKFDSPYCNGRDRIEKKRGSPGKLSGSGAMEKYPLPPSELCRRRKPRPLYKDNSDANEGQCMKREPVADSVKETPTNQTPLSLTEEFEERVRMLRKLRAEFFEAPPSRHCSSLVLNLQAKRDTRSHSLVVNTHSEDGNSPSDPTGVAYQDRSRLALHPSHSLREESQLVHDRWKQNIAPMPSPPMLSISDYTEVHNITHIAVSPDKTPRLNENVTEKFVQVQPILLGGVVGNTNTTTTLRPRPRPLHLGRRSLTNTPEQTGQRGVGRCSSLALPSYKTERRLSTPTSREHLSWDALRRESKQSPVGGSSSRLLYRMSDHTTGASCSRNASLASIKIPVKRRKPRGQSETKAIKTLGVIMGCFCLCWIPFFIIALARPLHKVVTGEELYVPVSVRSLFLWLGEYKNLLITFVLP
ncbi:unnamed protein product [Dicrocoelium dendriticum]|nr:unnamed protein product [Dicrocoelium dendriticum]